MQTIKDLLTLYKSYGKELKIIKIMVLIIINIWLLFIFWKIIALDGFNITNNNIALTKMQTMLGPLLQILGLDVLNPNILKMLIISMLIVISNLAVLYFSQMLAFLILGISARYSYKAYINYINKDTLNYYGFEKIVNLTEQEKAAILNDFITENGIKDPNVIGYLQNKINNINCINKNELILNINNNLLDYKQQILSKIILQQKEQINMITKQTQNQGWSWDTIDINTMLKIGGGIIITGVIIGIYYYFNNNAVQASKDMSNEVLNANKQISDVISKATAEQDIMITNKMQEITTSVLDLNARGFESLNKSIGEHSEKQIELQKNIYNELTAYQATITKNSNDAIKNVIIQQEDFIKEGTSIIEITKINNENMGELSSSIKDINNNITQVTNNMDSIILKTQELDLKINGGTQVINQLNENNVMVNQTIEYQPLLNQVKDISDTIGVLTDTSEAILTYLGLDTLRLSRRALEMLVRIREANAADQEVREYISENENDNDDTVL